MPTSHNGIAPGSNPGPFGASPFDSGCERTTNPKTYKTYKTITYMPRISSQKIEKISEQILSYLFKTFPKQIFTSEIAQELARDEEFTKKLLLQLEKKKLIIKINKNSQGFEYSRRLRWRISNKTYEIYKKHQ